METKKIFVLGNGFDLAHYLPTAYIHFMEAMQVIENSEPNTTLSFDDLFKTRLDNKDWFFLRTKELYKTDELILSAEIVDNLREKLKFNGWFQHFKHHLADVVTWIDFETEIETVLQLLDKLFSIEFNHHATSLVYRGDLDRRQSLEELIKYLDDRVVLINREFFEEKIGYNFNRIIQIFNCFSLFQTYFVRIEKNGSWDKNYKIMSADLYEEEKNWISLSGNDSANDKKFSEIIDAIYLSKFSDKYVGFNEQEIFTNLSNHLIQFINLFQWYILNIIEKLIPKNSFFPFDALAKNIEAVFNFNYTDSFQRFYPNINLIDVREVKHIHGSAKQNNIVLGISDLDINLKKYKIYSFVKAHQKIINNTDYQFLDEPSLEVKNHIYGRTIEDNPYEFIVWGHSLDISDEEYIKDIFNLNRDNARYTSILTVWYFDQPHGLLANLMNIMGKDIIQEWSKKGWLKFEKSPDIYQIYQDHYKDKES